MSKHTPGPWVAEFVSLSIEGSCVWDDWEIIAGGSWRVANNVDEEADAHLIAAAPELLEALEEWGEELVELGACGCDTASCRGTCTPAKTRAAIAKARGEV